MSNKIALNIPLGNLRGTGLLGLENIAAGNAPDILNLLLSTLIGVMTMIAALWFLFQVIIGAYSWITAGGDKTAIENARKSILNGLMGLSIVIAAIFILDLVGELFRLPFITDPGGFIRNIAP
jgi:hypothetical protein